MHQGGEGGPECKYYKSQLQCNWQFKTLLSTKIYKQTSYYLIDRQLDVYLAGYPERERHQIELSKYLLCSVFQSWGVASANFAQFLCKSRDNHYTFYCKNFVSCKKSQQPLNHWGYDLILNKLFWGIIKHICMVLHLSFKIFKNHITENFMIKKRK